MSPPAIDERRIEHEEPPGADLGGEAQQSALPQYTLRGLFAFITATAVCLSLGVSGVRVIGRLPDVGLLLVGIAAIVAWIVLAAAYRTLHAKSALVVHCLGMVVGAAFSFGPAYYAFPPIGSNRAVLVFGLFGAVGSGCLLGSAFSLPVFVVAMVVLLLRGATGGPRSQSQLPAGSDQPPQLVDEPGDHRFGVRREDGQP